MAVLDVEKPAQAAARRFDEPDDFAAALLGGEFECLPQRGEPFAATLRALRVGDMVVQQATTSAHNARGGIAPGLAVLMLSLPPTRCPARVNGVEVGAAQAILVGGDAEIASHSPGLLDWASLALPLPLIEELADLSPLPVSMKGVASLLTLPPERAERLVGALSAAGQLSEHLPMLLDNPDCAAGLAMALREEVAAALTAGVEVRPRPRAMASAMRTVAAAEAFMDGQLARPVYTEELCAALGVSARALHNAFRAVLGTSPHAYLKTRRLMLVHRALLSRERAPDLVKSIALGHGFWHLGHFARDYRDLFGKLPSETLTRRDRA
jgi:AraC-like DNA-binding protein